MCHRTYDVVVTRVTMSYCCMHLQRCRTTLTWHCMIRISAGTLSPEVTMTTSPTTRSSAGTWSLQTMKMWDDKNEIRYRGCLPSVLGHHGRPYIWEEACSWNCPWDLLIFSPASKPWHKFQWRSLRGWWQDTTVVSSDLLESIDVIWDEKDHINGFCSVQ